MSRIWRQGDVIVREVSEIPNSAMRLESNEIRIASETGNAHVLRAAQVFEIRDSSRNLQPREQYTLLEDQSEMTHPEHASLRLSPGLYLVTTVRDYAPTRRLLD